MIRHYLTVDEFSKSGRALRSQFENRFGDQRAASAGRFVWDFWNIPGQYKLLRTPAYHFFTADIYERWHTQLVNWGREVLGCHDISPPWMSCYVDGCSQQLHADHPHGPWAFVYSLTPWTKRTFSGGETQIMRPEFLNTWASNSRATTETEDIFKTVAPRFNRLLVFDPRLPHGVRRVEGADDVLKGRLVLHGWFVQPRPFFVGPLTPKLVNAVLTERLGTLSREMSSVAVNGYVSVRLKVSRSGEVERSQWLTNSLVGDQASQRLAVKIIQRNLNECRFGRAKGTTVLTVPVRFGL